MAKTDPDGFFQTHKFPLLIDEIQYAPELFSNIKMIVDEEKDKRGLFWLTGSQKYHLMQNVSESLAGRVIIVDMLGLSQAEIKGRSDTSRPFVPTLEWIRHAREAGGASESMTEVYERVWRGTFPELYQSANPLLPDDVADFLSSYIDSFLLRDVRDFRKIKNQASFYQFLAIAASRIGTALNLSGLSRDLQQSVNTIKAWLSVLEASGLIYLLRPFYQNIGKRVIKAPKLHFLDTGLVSHLCGMPDARTLAESPMAGTILETYAVSEILKGYYHNGTPARLYHYRNYDQQVVDLFIETAEAFHPVEIKKTASPKLSHAKHFPALEKLGKPVGHGAVLCFREKDIPLSDKVSAVPISYL